MNQTNELKTSVLQERTNRARQVIDQAVEQLATDLEHGQSETLKRYLACMGRFHRYSAGNILLIWSQKPEASHVAGFHAWKALGRQVRKGEKGIMILAPMVRRVTADDDDNNKNQRFFGFKTTHVFDMSQTDGKDLPGFARDQGDPQEHLKRLKQALAKAKITVGYSPRLGQAEGLSTGGLIMVKEGLRQAEEFSVLVHEWAHEILHQGKDLKGITKTVLETEAEAVAFVVCNAIGLDTNTASSDYIQLYSGNKETLMESLERIKRTAEEILREVAISPSQGPVPCLN